MTRTLKYYFICSLAALIATLYYLVATTSGLNACVQLAKNIIPGNVNIGSVQGNFLSKIKLTEINFQDSNTDVHIDQIQLDLSLRDLFNRLIRINSLEIGQVNVKLKALSKSNNANNKAFDVRKLSWLTLDKLKINQLKITIADTTTTIVGSFGEQLNLQWHIDVPNIGFLIPNTTGKLYSNGSLTGSRQYPQLNGEFTLTRFAIDDYVFPTINGKLATINNIATINLLMGIDNKVNGQIKLPEMKKIKNGDLPLQGLLTAQFQHPEVFLHVDPYVRELGGQLHGNLLLGGTLLAPELTGTLSLNHGHLFVPYTGARVRDIQLAGTLNKDLKISASGILNAGGGKGNIAGTIEFFPEFHINAHLNGNALLTASLHEYKIITSPDITLDYRNNLYAITGSIIIPQADIAPTSYHSVVTLSDDVMFKRQRQGQLLLPTNFALNLQFVLGDHVHLNYQELKTKLKGRLAISQVPHYQPTASGIIHLINGEYHAYGTTLTIEDGRVIYTGGSLSNPGLSIQATKSLNTVSMEGGNTQFGNADLHPIYAGNQTLTVGLKINGTLSQPSIVLFSSPAGLSQNDILSYLLTGYPQSGVGQSNLAFLGASSLLKLNNGKKSKALTEKLNQLTKHADVNVGSTQVYNPETNTTSTTTTVSVGKKLSKDLYLSYRMGLFAPVSILNLKYQLNKHFAIQSEASSMENAVDLMYVLERN